MTLLPERVVLVPFIFENPSPQSSLFSQINSIWMNGAEDYPSEKGLDGTLYPVPGVSCLLLVEDLHGQGVAGRGAAGWVWTIPACPKLSPSWFSPALLLPFREIWSWFFTVLNQYTILLDKWMFAICTAVNTWCLVRFLWWFLKPQALASHEYRLIPSFL